MAVVTLSTVVASAVATNGTITFAFPAGVTSADVVAGGEVLGLPSLQNVLAQAADTFTVAYSTNITVTYKDATSIPAGSTVDFQIQTVDKASATSNIPAATPTARGGVKQAASQPAAAGSTPTKAEYDALVASLKAAGIMASS